jgi:hypothetical protein
MNNVKMIGVAAFVSVVGVAPAFRTRRDSGGPGTQHAFIETSSIQARRADSQGLIASHYRNSKIVA